MAFRNMVKKVHCHSTFGKIEVIEPIFHDLGQQIRPFLNSSELTARCCSMPLQRVITDFGADHAFDQVFMKLEEHYGIERPVSSIRKVTEYQGQPMNDQRDILPLPEKESCLQQVVEIDGCMLPIVTMREDEGDQRKKENVALERSAFGFGS